MSGLLSVGCCPILRVRRANSALALHDAPKKGCRPKSGQLLGASSSWQPLATLDREPVDGSLVVTCICPPQTHASYIANQKLCLGCWFDGLDTLRTYFDRRRTACMHNAHCCCTQQDSTEDSSLSPQFFNFSQNTYSITEDKTIICRSKGLTTNDEKEYSQEKKQRLDSSRR